MARVGVLHHYAAGVLTDFTEVFVAVKQLVTDAGFTIVNETADEFGFVQAGRTADDNYMSDDIPQWSLQLSGNKKYLSACAIKLGGEWEPSIQTTPVRLLDSTDVGIRTGSNDGVSSVTIHIAADGVEGWWWMGISKQKIVGGPENFAEVCVGSRISRIPSDMSQGEAARYALLSSLGGVMMPYGRDMVGDICNEFSADAWSPLGYPFQKIGGARPGSPVGKMAAQLYPYVCDTSVSRVLFGAFEDVMMCTPEYEHLDSDSIPGWLVYAQPESYFTPVVLKAPPEFSDYAAI